MQVDERIWIRVASTSSGVLARCDSRHIATAFDSTARKGRGGFVGDHRQGVTPVPIPNTEVKPLPPMILLSGKVGYRRLYEPRQELPGGVLYLGASGNRVGELRWRRRSGSGFLTHARMHACT